MPRYRTPALQGIPYQSHHQLKGGGISMKRSTISAIAVSFMPPVFAAAPAISQDGRAGTDQPTATQQQKDMAAGQQDMTKQQQKGGKQTHAAIEHLKSA